MRALAAFAVIGLVVPAASAEKRAGIVLFSSSAPAKAAAQKSRGDLAAAGYSLVSDATLREALESDKLSEAPPLPRARELLSEAREAYESFEHARARSSLEKISELLETHAWDAAPRSLLAERFLLAGLVDYNDGQGARAIEHFRLANRLGPERTQLDPSTHRPGVIAAFATAVASNRNATPVSIELSVQPSASTVFVDGKPLPRGQTIAAGPHLFIIAYPGYRSNARVWTAVDGGALSVRLAADDGAARIRHLRRSVQSGATPALSAARELAALAGVTELLLFRDAEGRVEVAIVDDGSGKQLTWLRFGSDDYYRALRGTTSEVALVTPAAVVDTESDDSAWYGTWWGVGLIATGTVAVLSTGLYFALSSDSEKTADTVVIGDWCFEGECM